MSVGLLIGRMLLGGVFLIASLLKFMDRAGTRRAISDFGLPPVLVTSLGLLLPIGELMIAIALIPRVTAWWGAVGALFLLLLFILAMAINMARGRRPECNCFGQLGSSPIGWSAVARNIALAVVAGFVVWQGRDDPGASALFWLSDLTTAEAVAVLLSMIGLGVGGIILWLLTQLLAQNGRLLLRLDTLDATLAGGGLAAPFAPGADRVGSNLLPIGAPAPDFQMEGLYGETLTLAALRAAKRPLLLIFIDPDCGPCTALLPQLGRWQQEFSHELLCVVISRGAPEINHAKIAPYGLTQVLLQRDREVAQDYYAHGTPSAVLVHPNGTIGSAVVAGAEAIQSLVARTTGKHRNPVLAPAVPTSADGSGLPHLVGGRQHESDQHESDQHESDASARYINPRLVGTGQAAPVFSLPSRTGEIVHFAQFRGQNVLLMFWNPSCSFCKQVLSAFDYVRGHNFDYRRALIVISTQADGMDSMYWRRWTVLFDLEFEVGRTFGVSRTPSAFQVDADGRLSASVAVGAPAVLALLTAFDGGGGVARLVEKGLNGVSS